MNFEQQKVTDHFTARIRSGNTIRRMEISGEKHGVP